jgi:two-component system, cell cycle response regulator CpdR
MARILLVDDDDAVRGFVKRALEMDGHDVTTAMDGADALDQMADADGCFDLLLSDIRMPIMDGIALTLSVARTYPRVPILLITGYADQRERADGLDKMVEDVVLKPFTLAEIRGAVNRAISGKREDTKQPERTTAMMEMVA